MELKVEVPSVENDYRKERGPDADCFGKLLLQRCFDLRISGSAHGYRGFRGLSSGDLRERRKLEW